MIDAMSITDIRGQKFPFTIGESPTVQVYPVQHFDCVPELRSNPQHKMQAHGVWPHPIYMGAGIITVEGAIMADTHAEFNANYIGLKTILYPKAGVINRDNVKTGTLRMTPTGLSQLETDVVLQGFTCPLDGNLYAPFQIIWEAFDPFFVQSATGLRILY